MQVKEEKHQLIMTVEGGNLSNYAAKLIFPHPKLYIINVRLNSCSHVKYQYIARFVQNELLLFPFHFIVVHKNTSESSKIQRLPMFTTKPMKHYIQLLPNWLRV